MGFWPAVKRLSLGVGLIVAAALVLLAADWKHRAPPAAVHPAATPRGRPDDARGRCFNSPAGPSWMTACAA